MDILPAGFGSYIICISQTDRTRITGDDSAELTLKSAERIVCSALGLKNAMPPGTIDLYEGRDEIMLFARFDTSAREYYAFGDFEALADACKSGACPTASELYWYENEYILAVPVYESYFTNFSEFGEKLECGSRFYLFLKEHGRTIICDNAVNFIKNTF